MPVQVVLVDNVPELRAELHRTLNQGSGVDVVAAVEGGDAAVGACRAHQPDVVLLGLGLADLAGHDLLTRIRSACPQVRIVVYGAALTPAGGELHEPVDAFVEKHHDVTYLAALLTDVGSGIEQTAVVVLRGLLSDVATARQLVESRCAIWGCGSLAEDASLVVSELVSNAIVHAGTGCVVTLRYRPSLLRVEVEDHGTGMPDVQATTIGDEHGRGLLLVSALSTAWGAAPTGPGGKRVWAELAADQGHLPASMLRSDLQVG